MADAGEAKQKVQKGPGKRATRRAKKVLRRADFHNEAAIEEFMDGKHPDWIVAKVERALGASQFELSHKGVRISKAKVGALKVSRKAAHNPMVGAAISVGDFVLVDGNRIKANLPSDLVSEAQSVERRAAGNASARSSNSENSLFERANYRPKGVAAAAATRKAEHKKPATPSPVKAKNKPASPEHENHGYYLHEVKIPKAPRAKFEARPVIDPTHPDYEPPRISAAGR